MSNIDINENNDEYQFDIIEGSENPSIEVNENNSSFPFDIVESGNFSTLIETSNEPAINFDLISNCSASFDLIEESIVFQFDVITDSETIPIEINEGQVFPFDIIIGGDCNGNGGKDGLSAYELYVQSTTDIPVLSLSAWLKSLKADVDISHLAVVDASNIDPYLHIWRQKIDANYIHDQAVPKSVWTINHPLNKKVSVTITDTAGTVVEGQVTINNGNKVVIEFNFPFSGEAILN